VTLTADVKVDLAPFKSLISLRVSSSSSVIICMYFLTVHQLEGLEVDNCDGLELIYTQLACLEVYRSKSVLWVSPTCTLVGMNMYYFSDKNLASIVMVMLSCVARSFFWWIVNL